MRRFTTRWFQRLEREQGSALVEFGFVCILFLTMLLGICNFGHALYVYHFLSHASKSAARWAAVNGYTCDATHGDDSCNGTNGMNAGPVNETNIKDYVKQLAPMGIDGDKASEGTAVARPILNGSPTICSKALTDVNGNPVLDANGNQIGPHDNYPGCTVEVTVSYPLTFLLPLIPTPTLTLSSTSRMIIAH